MAFWRKEDEDGKGESYESARSRTALNDPLLDEGALVAARVESLHDVREGGHAAQVFQQLRHLLLQVGRGRDLGRQCVVEVGLVVMTVVTEEILHKKKTNDTCINLDRGAWVSKEEYQTRNIWDR